MREFGGAGGGGVGGVIISLLSFFFDVSSSISSSGPAQIQIFVLFFVGDFMHETGHVRMGRGFCPT